MRKKALDVKKFGGTESLGNAALHGHQHEVSTIETQSKTRLEDDQGYGQAAIIRRFTFGMNLMAFKERKPTKQDIFNHHIKGIEVMLWRDGMRIMTEVEPRITFDVNKAQYTIIVSARPAKGHILQEAPKTLMQLANG